VVDLAVPEVASDVCFVNGYLREDVFEHLREGRHADDAENGAPE
jgi:hypothetical protein